MRILTHKQALELARARGMLLEVLAQNRSKTVITQRADELRKAGTVHRFVVARHDHLGRPLFLILQLNPRPK